MASLLSALSRGDLEIYANGLRGAGVSRLVAKVITGAGHFVPDEQPTALWQAICEFIESSSDT